MVKLKNLFDVEYGQHELSSKEDLERGKTIVISSQGTDHGCYGFYNIHSKYEPLIISVPRTGSIGEAFVQFQPCCVDDNCLVLLPKRALTIDYLFYVCVKIRAEKWRYKYGRQITPPRLEQISLRSVEKFNITNSSKMIAKIKKEITTNIFKK